jgi:hypothetical protein
MTYYHTYIDTGLNTKTGKVEFWFRFAVRQNKKDIEYSGLEVWKATRYKNDLP